MNQTPKPKKRRKKWLIALGSIIVLLIIVRLILPSVLLKYVNKTLADIGDYSGHVEDIDLALIRGAYQIKGIRLDKMDKETKQKDSIPFFTSREIDLSIHWDAILKGAIAGEIVVEDPVLNFVKGKHKKEDVKADTANFQDVLKKLMPLTINHFEINNGEIHYIDKFSAPKLDVSIKDLGIIATNLTNANDSNKVLPANLKANGKAYEGNFDLNVDFNVLEKEPTFDLNVSVKNVNMVMLNDFFKAYGDFDLKKGNFGLYAEFAAKNGAFNGYVKPIIKDLDIVQLNKEEGNVAQVLWESVIGTVAEIFQNQNKEQLATKVPLKGKFKDPETGLWTAINYVLRNAFISALQPSIENTINIGNVGSGDQEKTLLQKVFGKKDTDKNKSK